ncbi:MAG: radical SAM protein, partial [Planctomycetota bacterium]
ECDRTFCRDAHAYDEANCFAFRIEALENGLRGARLFKKSLPEGRAAGKAFLGICRNNTAAAFKSRFSDSAATARIEEQRMAAVRLLARVDFFLCSNSVVYLKLQEYGIDDMTIRLDTNFLPLEGDKPDESRLEMRAQMLRRTYDYLLAIQHPEDIVTDQPWYIWPTEAHLLVQERLKKWEMERENHILQIQDISEQRLVWESRPWHIEFSTNTRCNLHCKMCSPGSRPKELEIGEKETRAICEQVFPHASVLFPSSDSEPLLGNIELLAELCDEYDVQFCFITNGTLLKPEKYKIVRKNLGRLQVSFDSHEKETYEEIRAGAKFETVVENIREACKLAAADNIEVTANMVVMTPNYETLAEYIDFVADLGVNSVLMLLLNQSCPGIEKWDVITNAPKEKFEREINRAIEAAKRRELNLHLQVGKPRAFLFASKKFRICKLDYLMGPDLARYPEFCHPLRTYLKIKPDGSVYPCCRGLTETYMGNLNEKSLDSIWNGERYQQLRKEFFTGKLRKCCRECQMLGLFSEGILIANRHNYQL